MFVKSAQDPAPTVMALFPGESNVVGPVRSSAVHGEDAPPVDWYVVQDFAVTVRWTLAHIGPMTTPSKDAAYFDRLYRTGLARKWDHSVPPTEVIRLCEGDSRLPPGRAIDLGCGTGTSAVFLARHGWKVVGIDFVDRALGRARKRAAHAAVNVAFMVGDVTRLPDLALGEFDLVLDVGCLHSLPSSDRGAFVRGVAEVCRPGGLFVLLAFLPNRLRALLGAPLGLAHEDVQGLFNEFFEVTEGGLSGGGLFRIATYHLRRRMARTNVTTPAR